MKRLLFFVLLIVFGLQNGSWASVTVPTKIQFADMKLTLDATARHKIKIDVDRILKSKTYTDQMVKKANVFFPVIERMFKEMNFPDEVKYLCIQESAFQAEAVSSSNAVGYWQFKKATAIEVGLKVGNGIDERKNIAAASIACAKYIAQNNSKLDNWVYALTAYNTGLGGVQKYVKKKDLGEKKMTITGSTHWYFLKFLAHMIAYQDLVGKEKNPQTVLRVYMDGAGLSVKQIGKKFQVPSDEMDVYNKWIAIHKDIPGDKPYYVIIPTSENLPTIPEVNPFPSKGNEVTTVEKKEAKSNKKDPVVINGASLSFKDLDPPSFVKVNGVKAIVAQEGDDLHSLAHQGGTTRDKIAKFNEVGIYHQVIPGKNYFIKRKKSKAITPFHVGEKNETLWDVAQFYGIGLKYIRKYNRMRKYEGLEEGRVLWLKEIRPEETPVEYKNSEPETPKMQRITTPEFPKNEEEKQQGEPVVIHTVVQGETLYSISKKYDVSVSEIMEWNNKKEAVLSIGEKLVIKK